MAERSKPDAEHRAALTCQNCGTEYWTSDGQTNECPDCGLQDYEIHGPNGHSTGDA